ncbi:hypothetical protein F2P79_005555 [Pimephales promelas]|nr:hypothetical protein F2P79_005555 [Pimephales promelas]
MAGVAQVCDDHVQAGPYENLPKLFWTSAAPPSHGPAHLAQLGFPLDKNCQKSSLSLPFSLYSLLLLSLYSIKGLQMTRECYVRMKDPRLANERRYISLRNELFLAFLFWTLAAACAPRLLPDVVS